MSSLNIRGEQGLKTVALASILKKIAASRPAQLILVEGALIYAFFTLSAGSFLNEANIRGLLTSTAQILLIAFAQAILMSAGQIDISQGAVIVLTAVIGGQITLALTEVLPLWMAIVFGLLGCLVAGALVGALNGVLVGVVGINSLVVTLGMLGIATGTAQVLTRGVNLIGLPTELTTEFGIAKVGVIPLPFVVSAVVVLITWWLYSSSGWGLHLLAIGSNPKAGRRVGLKSVRLTIGAFILSSTFAGLAGFMDLARYSTTNISGHTSSSLAAIAAALIGGTLLTGGRVNLLGAIVGTFLAILLQSGLIMINVSPFYQTIVIGVLLLVAVSLDPGNRSRLKSG